MKKILIALDHDPTAQKVAKIGSSFVENTNAIITLLHVVADPAYYKTTVYDPTLIFGSYTNLNLRGPDSLHKLKKRSMEFLEKFKHQLGNTQIKTLVKEGSIAETILSVAKELNADAIVMGSLSKRWLENSLMGSITEYVLHRTSIPLLIVPTKK